MLDLPQAARSKIQTVFYDSGHMFYLNPADLKKTREDLVKFLTEPSKLASGKSVSIRPVYL